MTKFENRPLAGDAEFDAFGTSAVPKRSDRFRRVPSRPVPDLSAPNGRGPGPAPGSPPPTLGGLRTAPATTETAGSSTEPRLHWSQARDFDVVAVIDVRGRFIYVSPSAEAVFGYDVSNVVGLDAFELFDAVSVEPVRALFGELVTRRRLSVSLEMQTVRADGRSIDLEVVAANHLRDPIGGIVVNIRDVTDLKTIERRAGDVDRRQAAIVESLADGLIMVDADGTVVRVNEAFEVMFEAPRVRLLGHTITDLFAAARSRGDQTVDAAGELTSDADDPISIALRNGRRSVGVVRGVIRPGRSPMWIRINTQAMLGADGAITGVVASISDVTAARQAAAAIRRDEQFLQVLLDTLEEGIVACDDEGRITVFNPAARQLHGLDVDADPIGMSPNDEGLRRSDGSQLPDREHPLIRAMSGEQLRDVEMLLESGSGEQRKVSVNGQALVDEDGRMLGAVVAMHDVTEQKLNEERLAEMALHDPLTGLANRTLLAQRLQEAIDALAREQLPVVDGWQIGGQRGVAVFLLDLDEFKEINDVLGHDVGDDMLVAVARRLSAIVRPEDTVARLGGDEFVVVCDVESGEEEMVRIGERISTALARPYRIDGRTLTALASVGGVFADNPDTDPSRLLSRADDAMYGVKWSRRRERRSMAD
jgi:diguanylate cyclase (GGDEF)-like protein/PAS domain S-box-containing protein